MNTKESLEYLVDSLIEFNLEQKNFINIILSAQMIQTSLSPFIWHQIIQTIAWPEIANGLKKHQHHANDLTQYLKKNHHIQATLFFKEKLNFNFVVSDINKMVQHHIKSGDEDAAEEILAAFLHYRENYPDLTSPWLNACKMIAVENGQVDIFLQLTPYLKQIENKDLYQLLARQINRLLEKKQETKTEIKECRLCAQLLELLSPDEKDFYQKLIF